MCKLLRWARKQLAKRSSKDEVITAEIENTERNLVDVTSKHEHATEKLIDQLRKDPLQEFLREMERTFRRND